MSDLGESLPSYQSEYSSHDPSPSQLTPSTTLRTNDSLFAIDIDIDSPQDADAVGIWARANRYLISTNLEKRLRLSGYIPDHDPERISEDTWRESYHVTPFELDTLKQLYSARYVRHYCRL